MGDVTDIDWAAFAERFGFDNAGQGCQPRHTCAGKLRTALSVDTEIGGSPATLLADAADHPDVPLRASDGPHPRYYFSDEVVRDV